MNKYLLISTYNFFPTANPYVHEQAAFFISGFHTEPILGKLFLLSGDCTEEHAPLDPCKASKKQPPILDVLSFLFSNAAGM